MKPRFTIIIIAMLFIGKTASSESITQTIKGRITDVENKLPIPGANIIVLNTR